jgi:tyrosinase
MEAKPKQMERRRFVGACLSTAAISAIPGGIALAQTTVRQRLEWQAFRATTQYNSLLTAISSMKANTNASDRGSWQFWANAHVNYCPHGIAYFLAWHRGYLYHFERQLQIASGNSALMLPYWDYYKSATMPAEFTNASTGNPLYEPSRAGTYVYDALTMAPFSSSIVNFQRGTSNAYEPALENAPHNPIHNLIGGYMAGMQSPRDPIFWLHHANIDRLWAAWVAVGGKRVPASGNSYWNGSFTYGPSLTLSRRQTYNTTGLNYSYPDLTLPRTFPPRAQAARIVRVQMQNGNVARPQVRGADLTPPRAIGQNRRSLGGARDVGLSEGSFTLSLPLEAGSRPALQSVLDSVRRGGGAPAGTPFRSAQLVLDNIRLTDAGRNGGYFYKIYVNLPAGGGDVNNLDESLLLGTIGPFEIASAEHHGNSPRLSYPLTRQLAASAGATDTANISIVRLGGNGPQGQLIQIGETRVELSDEEIE